ncbi:2Fe-2S iron-sulfur cluster binding domain-containing protein [Flexivirga sp. ID2601S]|uniref:2Fe-2S iron-sulfur cluster binding domain-containing protein n=1 Tax=Flexivirga aerilata TaxID=1656889 RepID=A0A849AKL8_9MICO|nr:FAD binding domain-containing protein [Flexivirga aerilata]NNG39861.1 2Fe-2S iron-sulfur cluster binding domain-containing protein [Flexivirga aerilata]
MPVNLNGVTAPLDSADPHTNALDWLRSRGLTGAKEGCAEGECGACSVLVRRPSGDRSTWTAINACLIPALSLDGQDVVTSEGLGTPDDLHPVQQEMAVRGGSQCGYCTPGFVCSMAAEYYREDRHADPAPATGDDGEHGPNGFDLHALSGNLCRCTGYRPIRDAAYALDSPAADDEFAARLAEPAPPAVATRVTAAGAEFVRPESLAEAVRLLADTPEAQLVAGATDWGVGVNLMRARAPRIIAIDRLPELRMLHVDDDAVMIGAALTLSEIEAQLDGRIPLLAKLFPQFASRLIRNGATLGGNLGTGSPIGDSPPVLLALESEVVLTGPGGQRTVPLADYFTGYRQSVRAADEIITALRVPLPLAAHTAFHKIAKRRFDDISSVAVAFAIDLQDGVVSRAAIGLGGVAATPLRARRTEEILVGAPWTSETIEIAARSLTAEGTPMADHRASSDYRRAMLGTSLPKFFAQFEQEAEPA